MSALLIERAGPVLRLTLNRPERANALDAALVEGLTTAFAEPDDARVIVLTGAGERAFCAGADLQGASPAVAAGAFTDLLAAMDAAPAPIIARVNGAVAGGGLGLVSAADLAIGAEGATFAAPEGRVGLFPFMILPWLLRVARPRTVAEMAFAGRRLDAAEAVAAGFLTAVAPAGVLDARVEAACGAVLQMAPGALAEGRRAFADCRAVDPAELAGRMRARFIARVGTDEAREGLAAFRERRRPAWAPADAGKDMV